MDPMIRRCFQSAWRAPHVASCLKFSFASNSGVIFLKPKMSSRYASTNDPNRVTHAKASRVETPAVPIDDELVDLDAKNDPSSDALPLSRLQKPSTGKPLLVLVSCGSFNPVTNLHLRLLEAARNYYMHETGKFDVIGGFFSPVNDAYPKETLVNGEHRLEMCRRGVESSSWINVASWEVNQDRWVRTAVVLTKYQRLLNDQSNYKQKIHVKLLCGADIMRSFVTPNLWRPDHMEVFLGKFGLACIERNIGPDDPRHFVRENDLLWANRNNIDIIPLSVQNDVSSSSVRTLIKRGMSAKYLIPDPVLDYVHAKRLFQPIDKK
eukprot:1044421_1